MCGASVRHESPSLAHGGFCSVACVTRFNTVLSDAEFKILLASRGLTGHAPACLREGTVVTL